MKAIRKFSQSPSAIFFMSFLVLFVSCNQNNTTNVLTPKSLDGEELFRSIIFANGAVTKNIRVLSNINVRETLGSQEKIDEYINLQEEAISYIKNISPGYFNEFKIEIMSKDPKRISDALHGVKDYLTPFANEKLKVKGLTVEAIIKEYKKNNKFGNEVDMNSLENSTCIAIVDGLIIATVAAVVVAVALWVIIANYITNPEPEEEAVAAARHGNSSLYNEELSISIAASLR